MGKMDLRQPSFDDDETPIDSSCTGTRDTGFSIPVPKKLKYGKDDDSTDLRGRAPDDNDDISDIITLFLVPKESPSKKRSALEACQRYSRLRKPPYRLTCECTRSGHEIVYCHSEGEGKTAIRMLCSAIDKMDSYFVRIHVVGYARTLDKDRAIVAFFRQCQSTSRLSRRDMAKGFRDWLRCTGINAVVDDDFDKTEEPMVRIGKRIKAEDTVRLIQASFDKTDCKWATNNKELADRFFSEPYPKVAKDMLGYGD